MVVSDVVKRPGFSSGLGASLFGSPAVVLLKFPKCTVLDADRGLGEDFLFPLGRSS